MKRTALISLLTLAAGIALFIASVLTFGLIGAVPYHDGPNAGFVSTPGIGRWIETSGVLDVTFIAALALIAIGAIGAIASIFHGIRFAMNSPLNFPWRRPR
jgi:hypothetical protein